MTFEKTISQEMRGILKSCTSKKDRLYVAKKRGLSIHTVNSVIDGKRRITKTNSPCIVDLLAISIHKANEMKMSLVEFYQAIQM